MYTFLYLNSVALKFVNYAVLWIVVHLLLKKLSFYTVFSWWWSEIETDNRIFGSWYPRKIIFYSMAHSHCIEKSLIILMRKILDQNDNCHSVSATKNYWQFLDYLQNIFELNFFRIIVCIISPSSELCWEYYNQFGLRFYRDIKAWKRLLLIVILVSMMHMLYNFY